MTSRLTLPAFSAYGIELEYMIVDRETLDIMPIVDRLLHDFAGHATSSVERGPLGWSNELVSHVIELKNNEPTPRVDVLADAFQAAIDAANRRLEPLGAAVLPTGMHPWMDPGTETTLWTAEGREIYRMYDRIFDCRRHGWSTKHRRAAAAGISTRSIGSSPASSGSRPTRPRAWTRSSGCCSRSRGKRSRTPGSRWLGSRERRRGCSSA